MSTTLTLTALRSTMSGLMGDGLVTGTFSSAPTTSAQDVNRNDPDGAWQQFWIQDVTAATGPITRVQTWLQTSGNTFSFYTAMSGSPLSGDAYELSYLSFPEMRQAINAGIALCGKALRQLVRDESQTLTANTYQYKPNFSAGSVNSLFPGGLVRVEYEYWLGQPTREWYETRWDWLDDETIQLPTDLVDTYATNPVRFTGYGPITAFLTSDLPTQVIATFDDDWMTQALAYACVYHAWLIRAARKTAGEGQNERTNAQAALQMWQQLLKTWRRGMTVSAEVRGPNLAGGWRGG